MCINLGISLGCDSLRNTGAFKCLWVELAVRPLDFRQTRNQGVYGDFQRVELAVNLDARLLDGRIVSAERLKVEQTVIRNWRLRHGDDTFCGTKSVLQDNKK